MKQHSRFQIARIILIFWCLFIGLGAVWGASCMLIKPNGSILHMQGMLPYFQVLPFADVLFQNYIFSGISLLIVNGISNLTAAVLLIRRKKIGVILGFVFGLTLMAWICIQFVIFPCNFLSNSFFIFGVLQAITGYAAWVFYRQEQFTVDEHEYPHIGTNPKELVVFFSRMGYTKQCACEAAEKSGAILYEIHATEPTAGTGGFWWCGRYGMHRWEMPIEPLNIDLTAFDRVTVCSPVWVFDLAAPMRTFCRMAKGKITSVDYILVHHMRSAFQRVASEMDELLETRHTGLVSFACHAGSFRLVTQKRRKTDE